VLIAIKSANLAGVDVKRESAGSYRGSRSSGAGKCDDEGGRLASDAEGVAAGGVAPQQGDRGTPKNVGGHVDMGSTRSAQEVLDWHLTCRQKGDLERDIADNYDPDAILLSAEGVNRGHDGVRRLAAILRNYVPEGSYSYQQVLVDGDVGMLLWTAHGDGVDIHDGADSYVVRSGRIIAQTIHYAVRRDGAGEPRGADGPQTVLTFGDRAFASDRPGTSP
jgi:hypothetical protein